MAKETKTKDAVVPATTPTAPQKRNLKKILAVIIGVVVAAIIVFVVVINFATSAPAKVSNTFIDYLQAGNADAAYSLFTAEAQAATDKDYFDELVEDTATQLTGKPDMQSKSIYGETGEAATATVEYLIPGEDATYQFTVNLQKENGEWKVLNYTWEAQ